MGRTVTLVLVTGDGTVLGELPAFPVATPWRQEVREVVAGALAAYGQPVTVLRLLDADGDAVRYLAATPFRPRVPLRPAIVDTAPQPRRARYAEVGGPEAGLAWARGVLGLPADSPATQVRTWNLASIWVLTTPTGPAWLKEVPDFFAHEGALLEWLAGRYPGLAPAPLAVDGPRALLPDVPGEDRYGAPAGDRLRMLSRVHRAQVGCVDAVAELLTLGVPDGRAPRLAERIRDTVGRYPTPPALTGWVRDRLAGHLAELTACGIPDTLVHGDLHPGNVRGTAGADTAGAGTAGTVLDWGDSLVGHPGLDALRMVEGLTDPEAAAICARWCAWWRAARPDSRPDRALELLRPVAALRNAVAYAHFLDHIEPAERGYHEADVPAWLGTAAAMLNGYTTPHPQVDQP